MNYKIYGEKIEQPALDQFHSAMELDCVVQGALMPDAHTGYSLPIGAVVATKGVIFPAWVGYDVGCGVAAARLNIKKDQIEPHRENIFKSIYRSVPTGMGNQHKDKQEVLRKLPGCTYFLDGIYKSHGLFQLGTLGGGNHFIEISYDEEDYVWVTVHSGSRGLGHKTATHYMKLASGDGKAREGHYGIDENSEDGKNYIKDLNFCLNFALYNRLKMIDAVVKDISHYVGVDVERKEFINRNHNHAEKKDGVWIHRKGATHAEEGMMGVIPGNMRDGSFIVRGKGNPDSLYSSSHGAGRVMSRKKAHENISVDDFEEAMKGITAKVKSSTKDESPFAYKNIFEVMDLQKDLVEVVHHLKPIINVKA